MNTHFQNESLKHSADIQNKFRLLKTVTGIHSLKYEVHIRLRFSLAIILKF